MAIRGERDVDGDAGGAAEGRSGPDQVEQALSQEGFPASKPDFFNAKRNKDANQAQVVVDGELGIEGPLIACPAVNAAVIAAVCNRNAKVGDGAAKGIAQAIRIGNQPTAC